MPFLPTSRVRRVLLIILAVVVVIVVVLIGSTDWLDTLGAAPTGERLARIQRSPNFRDGAFQNLVPTTLGTSGDTWKMLRQWLGGHEQRVPPGPMPIVRLTKADFATAPASGLRATWLGHSSVLVEIDGARILFDPAQHSHARDSSSHSASVRIWRSGVSLRIASRSSTGPSRRPSAR